MRSLCGCPKYRSLIALEVVRPDSQNEERQKRSELDPTWERPKRDGWLKWQPRKSSAGTTHQGGRYGTDRYLTCLAFTSKTNPGSQIKQEASGRQTNKKSTSISTIHDVRQSSTLLGNQAVHLLRGRSQENSPPGAWLTLVAPQLWSPFPTRIDEG